MRSSSRAVGARRGQAAVTLDESGDQGGLGLADRATRLAVELDRDVGDATRRDVGRDILLLATHDAHVDHRGSRRREEARLAGIELGVFELAHQARQRLLVVDPAEVLPDHAEVLDLVDQRRSGEGDEQRVRLRGADAAASASTFLRPLRVLVLDEVRLVDDHALEAAARQPGHVAVEHLVVDDHDVGEGVDVVAVAVHDGRGALRRPLLDLAGPVDLDDVGHDDQQRVRAGDGWRRERLRRLAESGLVGEQEAAVTGTRALDEARLVDHQLEPAGRVERARGRQVHGRGAAAGAGLERAEQRLDELPVVEAARGRRLRLRRRRSRAPGTGSTSGTASPTAARPASRRRRDGGRLGDDDQVFGAELAARLDQHARGASPARRA